jgi:hypothetical protein
MTIFIESIPNDYLTPIEFKVLSLCGASYRISDTFNPPPERLLMALDAEIAFLIHWLYKNEWNQQHRLPRMEKKRIKNYYEIEGDFQRCILRLCCALEKQDGSRTDKAVARWGAIFLESRMIDLKKIYNPQVYSQSKYNNGNCKKPKFQCLEDNGKKEIKHLVQHKINKLSGWSETLQGNPFDKQKQPYWYCLVEDALKKQDNDNSFSKNYWQPFIKAFRKQKNSIEGNGAVIVWFDEKEGKWYQGKPQYSGSGQATKGGIPIPFCDNPSKSTLVTLTWQELHNLQHCFFNPLLLE